jgi:sugar lactone lactonase YvrE
MKHLNPYLAPIFFFSTFILGSCSKKNSSGTGTGNQITGPVTITSVSPTHGPGGTVDTITGSGFNTTTSGNKVSFNGATADVSSATATQLIVIVPKLAGTGKVTVMANGTTGTGPVYTYDTTYSNIVLATGFLNAQCVALDSSGNLYVTNEGTGTVLKITSSGAVSTIISGLDVERGIAIDAQGNLYVANSTNGSFCYIEKISPQGVTDTLTSVPSEVSALTLDGAGNIYASAVGAEAVVLKISPLGATTTLASNPGNVAGAGIAIDPAGNLFVPSYNNGGNIFEIGSDNIETPLSLTGQPAGFYPVGIATTGTGILFVTGFFNNAVYKISNYSQLETIATLIYPSGIVADKTGNLFVISQTSTNGNPGELSKLSPQ